MKQPKKILIIRTDRIGDVVLTLPMAKFIKQTYPDSHITFLARDYTKAIPESNKFIDEVKTLPTDNGKLFATELMSMIKAGKYDTAILVYPRIKIALAVFMARVKKRIGSGYRWFSFLFTDKIYEHRKTGEKHELEYNLNLLKPLGIKNIDEKSVSFDVHVTKKSEQKAQGLFDEYPISTDKKLIIIHPGSGGSSIDLPISKFIQLSNRLAHELGSSIVITGSSSETETCKKFMNGKNIYNLAGKLNLEELMAVINKSDLFIANSTGPIHIAAALDKNVVGFYPKVKECSVERWGPYTNKRMIFSPTIDCKNCTREQCEKIDCMNSINVDEVFSAIQKLLK